MLLSPKDWRPAPDSLYEEAGPLKRDPACPPGVVMPDCRSAQSALSISDFLGAKGREEAPSFFFSRNARPPCLRSRPLNEVLAGLEGAGAKE